MRTFPTTLALATLTLAACSERADRASPEARPRTAAEEITRGEYLVTTSGCHDCHTPLKEGPNGPELDMARMLSGHPAGVDLPPPPAMAGPWAIAINATGTAWSGPWGISFTANLTPDEATGLGAWTRADFIATIRNGRHLGAGRELLPPMPFPMYKHMTDDDLGAIHAYLQSIPAVSNRVPPPVPPPSATAALPSTSASPRPTGS